MGVDMMPLVIAYALNLLDYAITAYWVNLYGSDIEANPFMRWAFENNIAWAVKIIAVGGLFALVGYLVKRYHKCAWAGKFLAVAYGLIVLYHIALSIFAITL